MESTIHAENRVCQRQILTAGQNLWQDYDLHDYYGCITSTLKRIGQIDSLNTSFIPGEMTVIAAMSHKLQK